MLSVSTEEVAMESAVSIQKNKLKHSGTVQKKQLKYTLR